MLTEAAAAAIALFILSRLRRARKVQAKAPSKAVTSTPAPKFEPKRAMVPSGASASVLKELTSLNDEILFLEGEIVVLQQQAYVEDELPWVVLGFPGDTLNESRTEAEKLLNAKSSSITLRMQRVAQILSENPSIGWVAR